MNDLDIIEELKKDLPETIAGIGYGSGFYRQKGYSKDAKPDKDIIFVVDNLHKFLAEDYQMNPEHFSAGTGKKYKQVKTKKASFFYHKLGCLKFQKDSYHFKLIIVEKEALLYDVLTWKKYGIAARLSKPIIYGHIPHDIENAILYDREAAIITALLSQPKDEITKTELYNAISGFSYMGDWRMITHSEKKTKAGDIVEGAFGEFENIYGTSPLLKTQNDIIQNNHPVELIDMLPEGIKNHLLKKFDLMDFNYSQEELEKLSKAIEEYFIITNMVNTPLLMYSCYKTLGVKKTIGHALSKRKNAKGW